MCCNCNNSLRDSSMIEKVKERPILAVGVLLGAGVGIYFLLNKVGLKQ